MIKRIISIICAAAMLFSLYSCTRISASDDLTSGLTAANVDTADAPLEKGAAATAEFAAKLFSLALESDDENVVISPLSAYLALAMTANGARGDTLAEFEKTLGGDLNIEEINLFSRALINRLTQEAGSTKLSIADSIWVDKDSFTADNDFLQKVVDYFGAQVFASDLQAKGTVKDVNRWIDDNTNGLIKEMLSDISPDTVMLLINTLYMKAKWDKEFDAFNSYTGTFTKADGSTVNTEYMSKSASQKYIKTDGVEGVILPYDDGRLGFVALRSADGKTASDAFSSVSNIKALIDSAYDTDVRLRLPKFKAEYNLTMNDILKSAGINLAFDDKKADLSGLGSASIGSLYISDVIQKVAIDVNEIGTEAAAATVIDIRTTSGIVENGVLLDFNSPFIYMIVDLESGVPLFMGILNDPS